MRALLSGWVPKPQIRSLPARFLVSGSRSTLTSKLGLSRRALIRPFGLISEILGNEQGKIRGTAIANVSETMIAPFRNLTEGVWTFDGEIVGRDLVLFDMIRADRYHDESDTFHKRHHNLTVIAGHLAGVSVLGYATGGDKAAVLAEAEDKAAKRER